LIERSEKIIGGGPPVSGGHPRTTTLDAPPTIYAGVVQPPILDFDPHPGSIIDPAALAPSIDVPTTAVVTWFGEIVDDLGRDGHKVDEYVIEGGSFPIHEVDIDGYPCIVAQMPVGAPAAAMVLERVIALGCTTIIAIGSAGGLASSMNPGTVVVPSEAVRDEGTSYHYLAPNVPARPDGDVAQALVDVLRSRGVTFTRGRTWTTDAIYRETRAMAEKRTDQGCVTVEMEAASLFAVASFRGVRLAYLLYVADTLGGGEWDGTNLVKPLKSLRRTLVGFAIEAVRSLR
jgi:uridine phosphorylase